MRLNKENFIKNELFQQLIETEDIFLECEPSEYTIFVLEDGTAIDALFFLGERVIDHQAILQEDGWNMERLITVEPETHTVILPVNPSPEQIESIDSIKYMWNDVRLIEQ